MAGKKRKRSVYTNKNGRASITKKQRGYVRTGGYYGKYTGVTPEIKFIDRTWADSAVANTGTIPVSSLVPIAQGTGESDRIGHKCVVKSMHCRGVLRLPQTSLGSEAAVRVRMIVVLDKQCNGQATTVNAVLDSTDINSFRNLSNTQRFQFIHDKTYTLKSQAGCGDTVDEFAACRYNIQFNKKMRVPLEFSSTTGAISELRNNNLVCMLLSDVSTVALSTMTFRMRFSDG